MLHHLQLTQQLLNRRTLYEFDGLNTRCGMHLMADAQNSYALTLRVPERNHIQVVHSHTVWSTLREAVLDAVDKRTFLPLKKRIRKEKIRQEWNGYKRSILLPVD